jgi:hypothetical protein
MSLTHQSQAASTAHSFNKIFNQARTHAKFRTPADVSDSVKKIRRLILVEGIPTAIVRTRVHLAHRIADRTCQKIGSDIASEDLEGASRRDGPPSYSVS